MELEPAAMLTTGTTTTTATDNHSATAATSAATATTTTATTLSLPSNHPVPPTTALYVRALYDYDSTSPSSISFRAGDLIRVLNRLESGWWDGILDDVRGWFPSNYTVVVAEEPVEDPEEDAQLHASVSGQAQAHIQTHEQTGHAYGAAEEGGKGEEETGAENRGANGTSDVSHIGDLSVNGAGDLSRYDPHSQWELLRGEQEREHRRRRSTLLKDGPPPRVRNRQDTFQQQQQSTLEQSSKPASTAPARAPSADPAAADADRQAEDGREQPRDHIDTHADADADADVDKYWVPRITQQGQVYWFNTLTGATSQEPPADIDEPSAALGSSSSSAKEQPHDAAIAETARSLARPSTASSRPSLQQQHQQQYQTPSQSVRPSLASVAPRMHSYQTHTSGASSLSHIPPETLIAGTDHDEAADEAAEQRYVQGGRYDRHGRDGSLYESASTTASTSVTGSIASAGTGLEDESTILGPSSGANEEFSHSILAAASAPSLAAEGISSATSSRMGSFANGALATGDSQEGPRPPRTSSSVTSSITSMTSFSTAAEAREISPHTRLPSSGKDGYIADGSRSQTTIVPMNAALASAMPSPEGPRPETNQSTTVAAVPPESQNGGPMPSLSQELHFIHDTHLPLRPTWPAFLAYLRSAVAQYRVAIHSRRLPLYIPLVENISDHLRFLLAAASDTTDNHSGTPSVIGNKELSPEFRNMMSRFSKMVVNSHLAISAAEFAGRAAPRRIQSEDDSGDGETGKHADAHELLDPQPLLDAETKCIAESHSFEEAMERFAEKAREIRGEEVVQLLPAFVAGSELAGTGICVGGYWSGNGIFDALHGGIIDPATVRRRTRRAKSRRQHTVAQTSAFLEMNDDDDDEPPAYEYADPRRNMQPIASAIGSEAERVESDDFDDDDRTTTGDDTDDDNEDDDSASETDTDHGYVSSDIGADLGSDTSRTNSSAAPNVDRYGGFSRISSIQERAAPTVGLTRHGAHRQSRAQQSDDYDTDASTASTANEGAADAAHKRQIARGRLRDSAMTVRTVQAEGAASGVFNNQYTLHSQSRTRAAQDREVSPGQGGDRGHTRSIDEGLATKAGYPHSMQANSGLHRLRAKAMFPRPRTRLNEQTLRRYMALQSALDIALRRLDSCANAAFGTSSTAGSNRSSASIPPKPPLKDGIDGASTSESGLVSPPLTQTSSASSTSLASSSKATTLRTISLADRDRATDAICAAATEVLRAFQPLVTSVERFNLQSMLDMQFMDFVRGDMARHDEDAFGNPMYGQAPSSLPSPSYPGSPLRSPNLMPPANSPFVPTHSAPKLSPRPATSAQALAHVLACKQNLYDSIGALIMTAQAIGAPLADEWSVIPEDEWPQKHTSRPCLGTALEPMGVRISLLRQQVAMVRGSLEQLSLALRILLDFSPSATRQSRRVMSRRHNFDGAHDMTRDSRAPSTMSMRLGSVPARPAEFKGAKKARMMKMSVRPSIDKAHRFFGEPTPGTPSDAGADRDSRVPPPSIGHSAGLSGYGSISAPSPTAKTRPWFLSCDNESEIVWEEKDEATLIKLGTLQGLVEQLTRHDKLDTSFLSAFLLTYRSFTTATELLEHLMHRFTLPPPSGLPTSELELWAKMKQSPIRIRVVNTLKTWLENYWMEPSDDAPDGPTTRLLRSIQTFVRDAVIQTKTPGGPQLLALVEKRLRIGMEGKEQQITMSRKMTPHIKSAPAPLWPKNVKRIKLLDINPEEMARQLSLIEIKLYTRIKPTECLNKTWTKKSRNPDDTDLYAPNIKAMIKHSNQLTNWVAETILRQNDVKRRVAVIKFFTNVADRCGKMNNYSSLMTIISALATAPIDRLGRTWYQVSARTMAILERMRTLMQTTKNFALYRQTLHNVNPPCIPFLGIYLTDLIFTEDGIASRPDVPSAPDVKWINFSKWRKTAAVIQEIQQFQNGTYQFQPVPELQEWIMQQMRDAQDCSTKAAYDRSLEIEPREREDEKITRLLSESGFL